MIDFIFTLDYEIYGNGCGTLRELVLEPTWQLAKLFEEFDVPFVVFAEALEFAKMEEAQSDPDCAGVRAQMRQLRSAGHEIALHLHPWWANARYEDGHWHLDWTERNIGALKADRVETIVSGAIRYLREALDDPHFIPVAFRAGQWLMQPTPVIASALARTGVRLDSSVFKGGLMHGVGLDYRPALANRDTWRFSQDVNISDPHGDLWEVPIHTLFVPFWRMLRRKRLQLQRKTRSASLGSPLPRNWRDFVRFRYPRKLDFCRLSFEDMRDTVGSALQDNNGERRVIVAIGHSKDFIDEDAVRRFLAFLQSRSITVTTFSRLLDEKPQLFC